MIQSFITPQPERPHDVGPGLQPLQDTVSRLLLTIEEENHLLAQVGHKPQLAGLIQRKSQLLLELVHMQRRLSPGDVTPHLAAALRPLREALSRNQELLDIHLAAAREINDTILDAWRYAESDGTYVRGSL